MLLTGSRLFCRAAIDKATVKRINIEPKVWFLNNVYSSFISKHNMHLEVLAIKTLLFFAVSCILLFHKKVNSVDSDGRWSMFMNHYECSESTGKTPQARRDHVGHVSRRGQKQSISLNHQSPKGQKQVPWTKMSQKAVGITEKIVVNGHEAKLTKECTNNDTLT